VGLSRASEFGSLVPREGRQMKSNAKLLSRRVLCTVGLMATMTSPGIAQDSKYPVVPLHSFFSHWDHHWYVWLRGDAAYEAVEIMTRYRGPDVPQLVWIFFTERAPPKRQVHFISDRQIASVRGWQYRAIDVSTSGPVGESQSVSANFTNGHDQPVSIAIERNPRVALSAARAGLTNQIGHSGDQMLMLFFREMGALSETAKVLVDGVDVSKPRPGLTFEAPFEAAYSHNILLGGFPYGEWKATFGERSASLPRFRQLENRWVADLQDRTTIELEVGDDGSLATYRHHDGGHQLVVRFAPAIPLRTEISGDFPSKFQISLDRFESLVEGELHATTKQNRVVFDWAFEAPAWLSRRSMQSESTMDEALVVKAATRDPSLK
jgi:hypothetical protein